MQRLMLVFLVSTISQSALAKSKYFNWLIDQNAKSIIGCQQIIENPDGTVLKTLRKPIKKCEKQLLTEQNQKNIWQLDHTKKQILGCAKHIRTAGNQWYQLKLLADQECTNQPYFKLQIDQTSGELQQCQWGFIPVGQNDFYLKLNSKTACDQRVSYAARWQLNKKLKTVEGCDLWWRDTETNQVLKALRLTDLSRCREKLNPQYEWQTKDQRVVSCQEYVEQGKDQYLISNNPDTTFCEKNLGSHYIWNDKGTEITSCFKMTSNNAFIITQYSDLNFCRTQLSQSLKIGFVAQPNSNQVSHCEYQNLDGKRIAFNQQPSLNECITKKEGELIYAYTDLAKQNCKMITPNRLVVTASTTDQCDLIYFLHNSKTQSEDFVFWRDIFKGMSVAQIFQEIERDQYQLKSTLVQFNAKESTIHSMKFPRLYNPVYRGMSYAQFSRSQAIRAMLGDPTAGVPTKAITVMYRTLTNHPKPNPFLKADQFGQTYQLSKAYQKALKAYQEKLSDTGKVLSEKEAYYWTLKQVDEHFKAYADYKIFNEMINSNGASYKDFNPEGMFGSYFYETAMSYGPYVTIIREDKEKRSVDLNYRVYSLQGQWGQGFIDDAGEVFYPVTIPPQDIQGYIVQEKPEGQIAEIYMHIEHPAEKYVLIVDTAQMGNKLVLEQGGKVYLSQNDRINRLTISDSKTAPHQVSNVQAPAMGLIKLCPKDRECTINKAFFDSQNISVGAGLNLTAINELKSVEIGGLVPKVFYTSDPIAKDKFSN